MMAKMLHLLLIIDADGDHSHSVPASMQWPKGAKSLLLDQISPPRPRFPACWPNSVRVSAGKPFRRSKWRPPISTKSCRPSTRPTTPRMVRRPRSGMRKVRPEDRAQELEISVVPPARLIKPDLAHAYAGRTKQGAVTI